MSDLHVVVYDQTDPRLGRNVVHDPRSRMFAAVPVIDKSKWRSRVNPILDPWPNPNQIIGNCTGCAKAMAFNAVSDQRPRGAKILGMPFADQIYSIATGIDPWEGAYPPDDTGSSGLAACKAAVQLGIGGPFRWHFSIDSVVQAIIDGDVVNLGTKWMQGMFNRKRPDKGYYIIEPTGRMAGGHEYTARGYFEPIDMVVIRCWWGDFRDVMIKREQLGELLADDGDAVVQERARPL